MENWGYTPGEKKVKLLFCKIHKKLHRIEEMNQSNKMTIDELRKLPTYNPFGQRNLTAREKQKLGKIVGKEQFQFTKMILLSFLLMNFVFLLAMIKKCMRL